MAGEPSHLPALVRWYMHIAAEDIPARIHSRDYGEGGTPEWHGAFKAWLLAHPLTVDDEGGVLSPFRFWLFTMEASGREGRMGAEYLYRLARLDGDWLRTARTFTPLTDEGELMAASYTVFLLQRFWRHMHTEPRRYHRGPKSEAQYAAEESA